MPNDTTLSAAPLALDRDRFLRSLLRELTGTLERIVGLDEAAGYVSVVGAAVGEQLERDYSDALAVRRLTREQVGKVLVDLKRRIGGDFFIVEEGEDRIVLGNRRCPFGKYVEGRESLCMMTSNVFGTIAARSLGYARVRVDEAIARGHSGCRIVVLLRPVDEPEPDSREYFGPER